MTFNSIKISDGINFRTSSKRLERAFVSHLTSSFKIINVMIYGPGRPPEPRRYVLRGLWGAVFGSCGCEEEEAQVRQACASARVILRAGMERHAGEGLVFTCGKGITAAVSLPARGLKSALAGRKLHPPPPPSALYSPELAVRTSLECEGGGRADVSKGAATMLGSGKSSVGKSREEKRTAEPGRRLGKRALKIRSLLLLTGTDTKCATIAQQSQQIHLPN